MKKEPCSCPCTSTPRIFGPMNFSRITIAILVVGILQRILRMQHSHITFLPQSHMRGSYPSRAVNELMLSLIQVTIHLLRMLRFFISYNVANTTMQKRTLHVNTPTQINRTNSIITILLFITKNSSNNIYCIYRLIFAFRF